jgi:hypothetical protein
MEVQSGKILALKRGGFYHPKPRRIGRKTQAPPSVFGCAALQKPPRENQLEEQVTFSQHQFLRSPQIELSCPLRSSNRNNVATFRQNPDGTIVSA